MSVSKAEVRVLCNLAIGFTEQKEFDRARAMLREAAESAGDDKEMEGLVEMAFCRLDWRSGRFEESRRHGEGALGLLREYGNSDDLTLLTIYLGNIERSLGSFRSAKALYGQALRGSRNQQLLVLAHWGLGNVAIELECYDEAFEHFKIALDLAGTSIDARGRGALRMGLALAYRERGDLDKALELSTRALEIFEEVGQEEVIADLYNNIGSIHALRGNRPAARENYEQALALLDSEAVVQATEAYREMARLDMEEGKLKEALDRARAALDIAQKLDFGPAIGQCSLVLGQAYMCLEEIEAAIPHLRRAQAICTEHGLEQSALIAAQILRDAEGREN